MTKTTLLFGPLVWALAAAPLAWAAPKSRIAGRVDAARVVQLSGSVNAKIKGASDKGELAASAKIPFISLQFKPSAAQQADLDQLLLDQQNASSPSYRRWLTPEQFGQRFGVSDSDLSKVTAWLVGQGFKIEHQARSSNWLAFSGTAGQVKAALHTSIHSFELDGKTRYANISEPSIPEALADIVSGIAGLDDIPAHSDAILAPQNTTGTTHSLAPEDWTTIYNVAPLAAAGLDGTGQTIAIVGTSDLFPTDLSSFRTRYGLPANTPKAILYGGADPGLNSAIIETNLDMEWAGAIAPNASLVYVYGASAFTAAQYAITQNLAPILSISYGGCELQGGALSLRTYFQQAAAQGISVMASTGDSGPIAYACGGGGAGTDAPQVQIPAIYPEVTGVGGTEFNEGNGVYWSATNDKLGGSVLGYIPEMAWNETSPYSIGAGGGGASRLFSRPAWQTGPGLPQDNARWIPDISFSASVHDAYNVVYLGTLVQVGGTSASAPSFAAVVALLNQYLVKKGTIAKPGLGNLNPQLYRLAQSSPTLFHDVTVGDNMVPCVQATPGCISGKYGYSAGPGWDAATGLGSADVNAFISGWSAAQSPTTTGLGVDVFKTTVNGTVTATAIVTGNATVQPTGSITFALGGTALGTVPVIPASNNTAAARQAFPAYLAYPSATLTAVYNGDTVYSQSGATLAVTATAPTGGVAGVVVSYPDVVRPDTESAQGNSYQFSFTLRDTGNTTSIVTSFTIDGQPQSLATYFPSPTLPANGTLSVNVVAFNVTPYSTKNFVVSGVDVNGNSWTRSFPVSYLPAPSNGDFLLTAIPLVTNQTNSTVCPWPLQINITDISGGYSGSVNIVTGLYVGGVSYTLAQIASIFGSPELSPYGSLTGTICQAGINPPASMPVEVVLSSGNLNEVTVSFAPAPANPVSLTAPSSVSLSAPDGTKPAQTTFNLGVSDPTQPWSITMFPRNVTSSWLSVSPQSGIGPAKITVTANGASLGAGAFNAGIVVQSPNASQVTTIPVMYVQGTSAQGPSITGVGNAASHQSTAAPGMLMEIYGSNLASATATSSLAVLSSTTTMALPFASNGVTVTINGVPAPILYVSPTQINVQVPYQVGSGPAVIGVNNNGQVGGFLTQISAAAPAIWTDANGNIAGPPVAAGSVATLYITGAGQTVSLLKTGIAQNVGTAAASLQNTLFPVSVSVGGAQAANQFIGAVAGTVGVFQINYYVPTGTKSGAQPVAVTINGVTSPAGTMQVPVARRFE